jgi:hypothetical protein
MSDACGANQRALAFATKSVGGAAARRQFAGESR